MLLERRLCYIGLGATEFRIDQILKKTTYEISYETIRRLSTNESFDSTLIMLIDMGVQQ